MTQTLADETRQMVRAYQARTGISIGQIGRIAGCAFQTIKQFMAGCYPHPDESLARQIRKALEKNPPEIADVEGKLYRTDNVRILDEQLEAAREGALSLIYGPPGTQKSFVFQRRVAEALRAAGLRAPSISYIYASAIMSRKSLAQEIARQFVIYSRGSAHQMVRNTIFALRRRQQRPVLIVDEAQHFGTELELLEVLRELVDLAGIGLIVAGHDRLEQIFDPDRSPLEQFVQRFDYRLRLPGLSEKEVREIATAELGQLKERTLGEILKQSEARDRQTRTSYYSARYLFKVIAQIRRARAKNSIKNRVN